MRSSSVLIFWMATLLGACGSDNRDSSSILKDPTNREISEMGDYHGPRDTPRSLSRETHLGLAAPIQEARRSLPDAKLRYLRGLPLGYRFFVTVELSNNRGATENAYVAVQTWEADQIRGVLATELRLVTQFKIGEHLTLPQERVVDWTITAPDGTEEGNYIGKYLDSTAR